MTLHTCRDFLSFGNPLSMTCVYLAQYFGAIFMRTVLGYQVVGQTNFNIDGSTLRLGFGSNGSINQGGTDIYAFAPNGYVVSSADINRILVIRSPGNPMVNSGLFRVTGINTASNWLYINYRSGDVPPVETGMTWALYENETVFYNQINTSGNGIVNTYQGQGTATQTRIILQSPSQLAWQVRLTAENAYDDVFNGGSVTPVGSFGAIPTTWAPGFGGNNAGDFQPGGLHLHVPLFFNKHVGDYAGTNGTCWVVGAQARFYMWGDDVTGTCLVAGRNVVSNGNYGATDSFVHFGLCEDEEQPLPPKNVQRMFMIGSNGGNGIYWNTGWRQSVGRFGTSFGFSNQPVSAAYSLYNPLAGETFSPGNTNARGSSNGGDNPYIAATELLPVDIIAGTHDFMDFNGGPETLILEGRRLGRAPFIRMGRNNYGYFQISTDQNRSWLHLNDGIYLPWRGAILP